jgi:hypothetical protein
MTDTVLDVASAVPPRWIYRFIPWRLLTACGLLCFSIAEENVDDIPVLPGLLRMPSLASVASHPPGSDLAAL